MLKDFDGWIKLKSTIHYMSKKRSFHEGEVWWCAVGENVGVEINGKSKVFSRPVLIYKKLSALGFLGIPLTSQKHIGSWYVPFRFQNKTSSAVLSQIRTISVNRLYERMGKLSAADFETIKNGFNDLYLHKYSPVYKVAGVGRLDVEYVSIVAHISIFGKGYGRILVRK